jgi:dienelactone hydrolase
MNEKWQKTMQVYDEYEKRFAEVRTKKELRFFTDEGVREQVIAETKKLLAYDEDLVPQIRNIEEISHEDYSTYRVTELRYETWEHFYGSASLYVPYTEEKLPLVFLCCGHGEYGRLSPGYRAMGHRLAKLGMAVMIPDNIGQGDRTPFGHWDVVGPFYCGLTLQGMIVMETIALIRHMQQDSRFDASRFGACGNSGGGTLTMFLAALAPELAVISSGGYPSEFSYLFEKERKHCACNLLPGVAYGPEMWEIYSVFAPKPMLLEHGKWDHLLPYDLGKRNARKIENTYIQMGAQEQFKDEFTETKHSWEKADMDLISKFLSEKLLGVTPEEMKEDEVEDNKDKAPYLVPMPEDAVSTDEMAQRLSGIRMPEGTVLSDIYKPTYQGKILNKDDIIEDIGRGDVMRVLAQMECAFWKTE